jgi:hypothetical protein
MKEFPTVITIFSAPNYCDYYQNKGAILKFNVSICRLRKTISKFNRYSKWSIPTFCPISKISFLGVSLSFAKMFYRSGIIYINLILLLIKKTQFLYFWLGNRKFWIKCLTTLKYWLNLICIRFKIKLPFQVTNSYSLLKLARINCRKRLKGRFRLKR